MFGTVEPRHGAAHAPAGVDRDLAVRVGMAYPYLPGSDTDAFKGLSVLVGLMVSLGASSIVGQAASGLILMYTRTFRVGEYVRIGDHEGTVTELGMFTTRIRTGTGRRGHAAQHDGAGSVTKNYSRAVPGRASCSTRR